MQFGVVQALLPVVVCTETPSDVTSARELVALPLACSRCCCTCVLAVPLLLLLLLLVLLLDVAPLMQMPVSQVWRFMWMMIMMWCVDLGGSRGVNTNGLQSVLPQPSLQHAI